MLFHTPSKTTRGLLVSWMEYSRPTSYHQAPNHPYSLHHHLSKSSNIFFFPRILNTLTKEKVGFKFISEVSTNVLLSHFIIEGINFEPSILSYSLALLKHKFQLLREMGFFLLKIQILGFCWYSSLKRNILGAWASHLVVLTSDLGENLNEAASALKCGVLGA